jgi:subtilisin-like proprotein convertase family protein
LAVLKLLNGDQFTYEFAAANGCSASVTITVTVNPLPTAILTGGGTICPPTNTAPAVQVTLTGVGPWEVTWTDGTTTTTQSGIIPYPLNPTGSVVTNPWTIPGSATTAGTYQVTSITDANGCSTPANYPGSNTVVVAPDGPPAAICDDITVQLDGNGFATITGGDVGSKSTDGCTGNGAGNLTLSVNPFLFTCASKGVNQVTLTATDTDNNSSTCTANVTVEDNIRPTITCANNVIRDASSNPNACYWEVPDTQLDPLSTSDNCGVASVTHDFGTAPSASTLQGAQFPKGTTTVVWTVADSSGNTRTCAINVTVNDNTTPTIVTCPPDRNVFTSIDEGYNCESFVPNMLNDLVWEDNCPSCVTTSQSPAPWSLVIGGHNSQTIVTFTVTDDNQSTTCTATLTLIDDEDPTFTSCPGPVNVECSDLARTPADLGEPTVADNCAANPTWTHSDVVDLSGCNNTGTITRTFTADDGNGNTNSSCVQVITVEDTEVPVITGFNDPTEYCSFTDIPRYDYNAFVAAARGFNKPDPDDNCGLDISSFTFLSLNVIGNCNANPNGPEVVETYQIADNCGNIDTAIVTFIINDTQGPIWDNNPPIADVTVNCEDNNSSVALGTPAFSDNCSATLTESQTSTQRNDPADCSFYNYTISRTFTVTDICGNSISHTQTITVQDTTAPVITCFSNLPPSQVVDTDAGECFATIGSGRLFVRAIENCPATDLTYTYDVTELSTGTVTSYSGSDAAGQYGKGDWKIEFFVTDPCGNSDMCVQTFTVEDNEAPMISCVGTLEVVLGSDGTATIDSSDIVTAINDNCPGATVALDKSSFDCSEVTAVTGNTITVTATVTDHSGNTADCSTIVTVKDNLPPTPDCQDITVYLDATCNASITAAEVAGTPSDNCQAIVVGASPLTFDGSDLTILSGNNPNPPVSVTVDYTDPSGNDASCTALVRVKDTIPPSITCLDPAPVNNELDKCEAFVNVPVPSLGDNCQVTTLTNDYTNLPSASATYPVGTTVVTWRVFDFAGNYTECAVDVNVIDAQAPEAICQDITVQLDANGQASITPADLDNNSSDNCPDFTLSLDRSTFDCSDIQGAGNTNNVVAVTLTITDVAKPAALDVAESDQATCNVTVRDEVLPIALCQNTTVQLDANGAGTLTAAQVDNGSNDACGIAPGFPTISKTAFDCSDVGTQSITLTVEDVNGNSNIVSCDVTIKDKVAPVAVCQDTIVQLDHSGNGILTTAMVDDGSSDACGIASLVVAPSAFTCADLGTNQVTLTVTDVNGNVSTCTSNVEVRDAVSPTAKCLDLTIQLDANGAASITVADIDKGTDDNCDQNPTITISKSSFGCADVGTNQVTLRAVDNFGNDATCISTITVEDNIDPTALCAADFSVQLSNVPGNGTASITVADIDNGSSDACGLASTTIDKSSFDCSDLGANVITLTVVDVNANISTCTTTVTVEDVSDPVITAAGFTQCNDPGTCDAAVSIVATATDNCSIMNSGWSAVVTPAPVYGLNTYQINGQQGLDASGTYPVGTVRVLFNVVDQSGNFDTLSVTVIIEDCDAPVITQAEGLCDSTITLPNVTGDCYQQYAWTHPTASDNCLNPQPIVRTISNPSVQPSNLPGSSMALFPVGTTTITYTATDGFNNVTTCTFDVEVVDTEDPVILNCPTSPISLNSDPGSCSKQFVLPNNIIANDNCPIVALTDDVPAGSIFEVGTTTVTFTATDNSGRTTDCVFDVIVNDTEAPILTCSPDIVVDNDPGVCGAVVNYPIPQYTDGCIGFKNMLDPSMLTIAANIRGLGDGTIDTGSVPHFITMTSSDNATPSSGGADTSRLTFVAPNANNLSFTFTYETPDERAFFDMFGYEVNGVFTQLVDDNDLMATGEVNIPLNAGDVFSWEIRSFDGFGGRATVVISQPAFGYLLTQLSGLGSGATFPVGTTTEQWMVEDPAGNKDTCSFTVTVNDTEAPAILANSTTTVTENGTGGSLGNSMINSRGTYRFTLNVGNGLQVEDLSLSLRGTHGFVGDLDILLTSPSGTTAHLWDNNLDNGTDDFDVTFDDNSGQQLTHTNANGPLGRGLSWRTNADGEDEFGMLVGNPTNLGAFTGESANGTWTLTIIDNAFGDFGTLDQWSLNFINAIPNTVPAADITLPNDPGQCGATVNYGNLTVSDNCPGATLTQTSGSGSGAFYPIGTSTETFVATDAAGNTAELSFVITVEDQEAPSINCPPSSTVGNDPGDCDATIQYTIGFNDNCSATLTQTSGVGNGGSVPVGGSSTETYVVTDASGNTAGCSFTLTVEDREAPQVSGCPGNITVDNDPGLCAAVVSWNTNNLTTSDNCPGETLASNFQSGDAFPVGTTTVIYTVTDAAGLTAACSFDVTVNDTEGPVITCPADITVTQDVSLSPTCGANVTSFIASATDNCSATITNGYHAGGANASGFFSLGTTTVTFTATDPAGNTDACSATVTVNPAPATASVTNGTMNICSDDPNILATGNNPGQGFSGQWTVSPATGVVIGSPSASASSITFPAAGTYTVSWTVTNDCDPATSASASFTVNVFDKPGLAISGTGPTVVGGTDGTATVVASGGSGSFGYSWDNGGTTATITGLTQGTYTVTVTDLISGCVETASITLNDPALIRVCYVRNNDPSGFSLNLRPLIGSIPGNGTYIWNGLGTYHLYANGEVHIFGSILDRTDNTKEWYVDIWLEGREFWGPWAGAGNGWAGNPATVGTDYISWTYFTLNGTKSIMIGQQSFLGSNVSLTNRSYTANSGPGGWQEGSSANNFDSDYGLYGQFNYTGSFAGYGELSIDFTGCFGTFRLRPVAILEGAFDGSSGLMRDDLNASSLVPTTEPYTGMGYTHVGGGNETVAQSVLNTTGPDAIVDWVILELRDENAPTTVVASRSALLQADGDIVDVDGNSAVAFEDIQDGNYYVTILHRNHAGIMTAHALPVVSGANPTSFDFTTAPIYGGSSSHATVGTGLQALTAGDANGDGQVQNTDDVYLWQPTVGSAGYEGADYNLDGQVQNNDKVNYWITNAGMGTSIPK